MNIKDKAYSHGRQIVDFVGTYVSQHEPVLFAREFRLTLDADIATDEVLQQASPLDIGRYKAAAMDILQDNQGI